MLLLELRMQLVHMLAYIHGLHFYKMFCTPITSTLTTWPHQPCYQSTYYKAVVRRFYNPEINGLSWQTCGKCCGWRHLAHPLFCYERCHLSSSMLAVFLVTTLRLFRWTSPALHLLLLTHTGRSFLSEEKLSIYHRLCHCVIVLHLSYPVTSSTVRVDRSTSAICVNLGRTTCRCMAMICCLTMVLASTMSWLTSDYRRSAKSTASPS